MKLFIKAFYMCWKQQRKWFLDAYANGVGPDQPAHAQADQVLAARTIVFASCKQ